MRACALFFFFFLLQPAHGYQARRTSPNSKPQKKHATVFECIARAGQLPPISVFETKSHCVVHVVLFHASMSPPTMEPATLDETWAWQFEAKVADSAQLRTHSNEPETYSTLLNAGTAPCSFMLRIPFPMESNAPVTPKYERTKCVTVAIFEFGKLNNGGGTLTLDVSHSRSSFCRAHKGD